MSPAELTEFLWNTYQPNKLWFLVLAMGAFTIISVYIYNKMMIKTKER